VATGNFSNQDSALYKSLKKNAEKDYLAKHMKSFEQEREEYAISNLTEKSLSQSIRLILYMRVIGWRSNIKLNTKEIYMVVNTLKTIRFFTRGISGCGLS
jgi:hypothetical protein